MSKIIGLVGGVGPYAGIDVNNKIFKNTIASTDQEHLDVFLLSRSQHINDRTRFLENIQEQKNPAEEIYRTIKMLYDIGARVIGIPCNTAHTLPIFSRIQELISKDELDIQLVNMIEEIYQFLKQYYNSVQKVGLLSTRGLAHPKLNIYSQILQNHYNFCKILTLSKERQEQLHDVIYNKEDGIKSQFHSMNKKSKEKIQKLIDKLKNKGAEAIISGCSEIPLILPTSSFESDCPLIDPNTILARALIRESAPQKLRK
jgi:aspartate racemase